MKPTTSPVRTPVFPLKTAILIAAVAVAAFHLAYYNGAMSFLIAVFLFCLFALTHVATARQAFYIGLGVGLAVYAPQLAFFWKIFGPAAIALWFILAFFPGLFVALGRACLLRFGSLGLACFAPFLWTGLEYFRSELYYLRFSWLIPGYAFSKADELPVVATYGVYAVGFLLMGGASLFYIMPRMSKRLRIAVLIMMAGVMAYPLFQQSHLPPIASKVKVAGIQMEYPGAAQVRMGLDSIVNKHPDAELVVLSEYTFDREIPELVKNWCREHKKYLVAGGQEYVNDKDYFDMAYVVGPDGEVVFKQAKCVPIQFFKDGLPAREQSVWNSPWGKIGLGICYDSSYRRVVDGLVKQGAQALIFPTMDVASWGEAQHKLNSLIVPMRSAEYRIPAFRLCSSGISMITDRQGKVLASAPYPGEEEIITGVLEMPERGHIPMDRWLAPICVAIVTAFVTLLISAAYSGWRQRMAQGKTK